MQRANDTATVVPSEKRAGHTQLDASADLLDFVNDKDRQWHRQPRDFEREAITRLFALLTLPARLIDPSRPAELGKKARFLRNVRIEGAAVRDIFFTNQSYTEVDAVFIGVGSPLGHLGEEGSYVIEVERKAAHQTHDYYRAECRARSVARELGHRLGVRFEPVLIFDDREGKLDRRRHDEGMVALTWNGLRETTFGLRTTSVNEIPGRASDRTIVKLELLYLLAINNPDAPRDGAWTASWLISQGERQGIPLHLPVEGHQDLGTIPSTVDAWLQAERESDDHLVKRIDKYLEELESSGLLERDRMGCRLTEVGGEVVHRYCELAEPLKTR